MMNEKLRKRAAVAGLCLLLAVGLVSVVKDTQACPAYEVETEYYSDAAHQNLIGRWTLECNCNGYSGGGNRTSPYRVRTVTPCD